MDINPYQGEIDVLKVNYWLQQLEFYFSFHHIDEGKKISCYIEVRGPCFNLVGDPHINT